jgi:hypothetical protein
MTMSVITIENPAPTKRETVDFDRLDDLIAWGEGEYLKSLEGLPSEWVQGEWVATRWDEETWSTPCGTVCCMAGRVGLEDKVLKPLPFTAVGVGEFTRYSDVTIFQDVIAGDPYWGESDTVKVDVHVGTYAERVLGLDRYHPAGDFFEGSNRLSDLKRIRDALATDAGVRTRYGFFDGEGYGSEDYELLDGEVA